MFSTLWLSEMLFLFINYIISIFRSLSKIKSYFQNKINDQNISSGEKTRTLNTLAKLFQAMRSRPVSWQCLSGNVTLEHQVGLKIAQMNYENSPEQIQLCTCSRRSQN